jgi:DNA topoisomerase-3
LKLIIAEKNSVGQAIAAVLGAKERNSGYLEGGGYLVSWCVGHLAGWPGPKPTIRAMTSGVTWDLHPAKAVAVGRGKGQTEAFDVLRG